MVQWIRLHSSTAGGVGSISSGGTKILHAMWCNQIKIKTNKTTLLSSPPSFKKEKSLHAGAGIWTLSDYEKKVTKIPKPRGHYMQKNSLDRHSTCGFYFHSFIHSTHLFIYSTLFFMCFSMPGPLRSMGDPEQNRNINNLRYADDTTLWQKVKRN